MSKTDTDSLSRMPEMLATREYERGRKPDCTLVMLVDETGDYVAECVKRPTARRLVASWNACKGIKTGDLEELNDGTIARTRGPAMTSKTDTDSLSHTAETPWLVYSREHNVWWRANHSGYTNDITQAGRYTKADAEGCCNQRDKQSDGSVSEFAMLAPEASLDRPVVDPLLEEARTVLTAVMKMAMMEDECRNPMLDARAFLARLDKALKPERKS